MYGTAYNLNLLISCCAKLMYDLKFTFEKVDIDSQNFKSLPCHQQAEVLMELRDKRKQSSWAKLSEMPKEAQGFSGFQLERLKKRSAMQKRLDEVGNKATEEEQLGGMRHHKLFVGDKEGMKRQKDMKMKMVGKDFVYLARDKDNSSGEGSSKMAQEGDDELTQEEILATMQNGEKQDNLSESEDEEDEVLILEPSTTKGSSRSGGVGQKRVTAEAVIKEEADSDSSSDDDFVEVSVDPSSASKQQPEDDIFADVFEDDDAYKGLENILEAAKKKKSDTVKAKTKSNVVSKPKEDEKDVEEDLASSMKEKGHLFLQIAARWAEDSQKNNKGKDKSDTAKDNKSDKESTENEALTELNEQLESDAESLLREMKDIENRERILRASEKSKTVNMAAKTVKSALTMEKPVKNLSKTSEEHELLEEMGVEVHDKTTYDSEILPPEPKSDDGGVVFGSSAPGFVRSRKEAEVIEISNEGRPETEGIMDEDILRKLNGGEEDSEDQLLTRDELAKIQVNLLYCHSVIEAS